MPPLSMDEASRLALEAFQARHVGGSPVRGLKSGPPVRVSRLDRDGAYLLVPVRDATGLRGIVGLDARLGTIESTAVIADPSSEFLLPEGTALRLAKRALPARTGWKAPFLGWRPCRESYSSIRPLWVVEHDGGTAFVTQSGVVVEALTFGRGG